MITSSERLPIVVDLPTHDPRLGFETYVDVIARAILGGYPARFTVALYGDWGSGKSSLLKALKGKLGVPPERNQPALGYSPILVDFDAWRYADKGAVTLSMLLRIESAVERRTQTDGVSAQVREGLKKTLSVIRQVIKSVQISAWGLNFSMQPQDASASTDAEAALQPFEQLSDIASQLPSDQRIIVFIDDLDRCTPEAVVDVVEAINVLTDIEGIVFVLALDYRYLTNAIRAKYKDVDADQFIEKIVQVPFHIPTPQIDNLEFSHVINNWDEVSSFLSGVSEDDLKAILRLGLRSNPRQLKRLINLYLITSAIANIEEPMRNTALKLLALRISWPTVFLALQKDLEVRKRADKNSDSWRKLKFDDFLASWRRNQQAVPQGEIAGVGEEESSLEFKSDFGLPEDGAEALDEFFSTLFLDEGEDVQADDVLSVMLVAQETTRDPGADELTAQEPSGGRLRITYDLAPDYLRDAFERAKNLSDFGDEDNSQEMPHYYRFSRSTNRRNTVVYAIMRIRPKIETLRIEVTLFDTSSGDLGAADLPEGFVNQLKQVEGSAGDWNGTVILDGLEDQFVADEKFEQLKRILRFAYDRVGCSRR